MVERITVDLASKTLRMAGKRLVLDEMFLGAEADSQGDERTLSLKYVPTINEDDSPVYKFAC